MGSSAAAAAAAAAAADSAQWLSVKEETIFLHDGLIRVTDLAELPSEILGAPEAADTDLEVREAPPGLRHQISPSAPHPQGRALPSPLYPDPRPPPLGRLPRQVCVGAGQAGGDRGRRSADRPPPSLLGASSPLGISFVVSF